MRAAFNAVKRAAGCDALSTPCPLPRCTPWSSALRSAAAQARGWL